MDQCRLPHMRSGSERTGGAKLNSTNRRGGHRVGDNGRSTAPRPRPRDGDSDDNCGSADRYRRLVQVPGYRIFELPCRRRANGWWAHDRAVHRAGHVTHLFSQLRDVVRQRQIRQCTHGSDDLAERKEQQENYPVVSVGR